MPALAQAECTEAGCKQYEVEIPESGAHKKETPKSHSGGTEPKATASGEAPPKTSGSEPTSEPKGESESKEKSSAAPAGNGGNNNGGNTGSGSSTGGSKGNEGLGGEQEVAPASATGKPVSHSSGGSSPLVPILIAIAVLAAISIGAVIYRQRRQQDGGSGSPVSPKAG
jgi:cobalamin biosynthesis Mg chelatase CobN